MTAIDEAGERVARFCTPKKRSRSTVLEYFGIRDGLRRASDVEVAVNPIQPLTTGTVLMIGVASEFVVTCYAGQAGGGGG